MLLYNQLEITLGDFPHITSERSCDFPHSYCELGADNREKNQSHIIAP